MSFYRDGSRLQSETVTPLARLYSHRRDVARAAQCYREVYMSIARVVEITATSDESFEDALQQGVARATQTLRNVRSAWVKEQEIQIEDGQISSYKVNMLVTFVLDDNAELDESSEGGSGGGRGRGRKSGGRRGRG
jgi:flavin-binding protein dodecin